MLERFIPHRTMRRLAERPHALMWTAPFAVIGLAVASWGRDPLAVVRRRRPPPAAPRQQELHQELRRLLAEFRQLAGPVPHWAVAGTLLGLERHGDIIPWDDDIDLGVWMHDMPDLLRRLRAVPGLHVARLHFGWKLWRDPHASIDLFPFRLAGDRIEYAFSVARRMWQNEWFAKDELLPLRENEFGGQSLAAPAVSYPYLDRSYPGWAERAVVQGSHLDPLDLAHSVIFRQEMRFDRRRLHPSQPPSDHTAVEVA